jgi:hypothetical protein
LYFSDFWSPLFYNLLKKKKKKKKVKKKIKTRQRSTGAQPPHCWSQQSKVRRKNRGSSKNR